MGPPEWPDAIPEAKHSEGATGTHELPTYIGEVHRGGWYLERCWYLGGDKFQVRGWSWAEAASGAEAGTWGGAGTLVGG